MKLYKNFAIHFKTNFEKNHLRFIMIVAALSVLNNL